MKNLAGLMKQAQQMQSKMQEMQAKLEAMDVEGTAGFGMVTVTLNAPGRHAENPDRPQVGRSIGHGNAGRSDGCRPFRRAKRKMEQLAADEMQKISGGLNLPPGMKLPF